MTWPPRLRNSWASVLLPDTWIIDCCMWLCSVKEGTGLVELCRNNNAMHSNTDLKTNPKLLFWPFKVFTWPLQLLENVSQTKLCWVSQNRWEVIVMLLDTHRFSWQTWGWETCPGWSVPWSGWPRWPGGWRTWASCSWGGTPWWWSLMGDVDITDHDTLTLQTSADAMSETDVIC